MRLHTISIATAVILTLAAAGCKSDSGLPPNPMTVINGTRDRLTPFRFTLATDPTSPSSHGPTMLKVHVIDAAGQPADNVEEKADVSMSGMDHGAQHLTLDGRGGGDYEGQMNLEMAGSWDVNLTASRDGKTRQQKLSIEVGG
jgi:nitrogen fixation protein FixH